MALDDPAQLLIAAISISLSQPVLQQPAIPCIDFCGLRPGLEMLPRAAFGQA